MKSMTQKEIEELLGYLSERDQAAARVIVHFANLARRHPDSTWDLSDYFPDDGSLDSGEAISSAELIAEFRVQFGALLRLAVLRKWGMVNS